MPGIGQLLQGRWIAAAFYGILFLFFFILTMARVCAMLVANYRAVMDFTEGGTNQPFRPMSPAVVIVPAALAVLVYLAGLIDTVLAVRREVATQAPLPPPLPPPIPPRPAPRAAGVQAEGPSPAETGSGSADDREGVRRGGGAS
jgi:hypothetical protein